MLNLKKLKGLLAENDMNQSKLAKLLKVSTSTLSRKMKKRSEFTLIEAKVIADFFNKTIDEIFFYESD